jgi:hypothetical protein
MRNFEHQTVEEIRAVDERQVDGLLEVCRFLATQGKAERGALMFMDIDPLVVLEAKRKLGI